MNKLNGNALKIIALVSMTIDHIGKIFFPSMSIFKILGRISFPIFAYMIAEGWKYTSNRIRYFSVIFSMGILYLFVYYVLFSLIYVNVFLVYSFSVLLIWTIEYALKKKGLHYVLPILLFACIVFMTSIEYVVPNSLFFVDYGLIGILLAVVIYFCSSKISKLCFLYLLLCVLSLIYGGVQFFCLFSIAFLILYNGNRGKYNMKSFFYIYYPLHLVVLWILNMVL